jgi:hypothetical protein
MYKLGYTFDVGESIAPQSVTTAVTGKRVNLRDEQNINFVVHAGAAASGTDALTLAVNQHNAVSSGTTAGLPVSHYWLKSATPLTGTESWTLVSNLDGSGNPQATVALATALSTAQVIVVVEINTKDLTDGFDFASVSTSGTLAVARIVSSLAVPADLLTRRSPANVAPTLH